MTPLLLSAFLWAYAPPLPSPEWEPAQVVATVVAALAQVDTPTPNSGIFTTYQFASPANRNSTGPYGRFIRLVRNPGYQVLLHPARAVYGPLSRDNDQASQVVELQPQNGPPARFEFFLSRQSAGPCRGCWMIDSVRLLP
jgi:hypothetical protein